jgi:hypothetical protein
MQKIGQKQAAFYRKRAMELERVLAYQKNRWAGTFSPGWVNIATLTLADTSYAKIETARLLGHAVLVVPDINNQVRFYADKL